jgi:hypothetical protein
MSKSKCQMNAKSQIGILKRVQNDILVMPNLLRHLILALDLIPALSSDIQFYFQSLSN